VTCEGCSLLESNNSAQLVAILAKLLENLISNIFENSTVAGMTSDF